MTPEERVLRVVRAARTLKSDALVDRIAESTGLSRENVVLGFDRHLETHPSEEEIASLVRSSHPSERVNVLLSSTVFVAALRAIAWAWAGAPRVVVRPSKREPHFARALVRAIDHEDVTLDEDLDVANAEGVIHVYGRQSTIDLVRARARVPVIAHGPGMGIAIVRHLEGLEHDVIPFDQRGCLSPRVVFALEDVDARALVDRIDAARIPRGRLGEEERSEAARWLETMTFAGEVFRGESCLVSVSNTLSIPPTGRHVQIVRGTPPPEIAPHVTMVGVSDPDLARFAPVHARVAPLGQMQRPPLDGPVDKRNMS